MIWYDMIYVIWYHICDIWYMIWCMIWYDMIYNMIYLTAIVLSPGGSSRAHIYTQTIHRKTIDKKQYIEQHISLIGKSAERALCLRGTIPWHLPYNWGESTEKPHKHFGKQLQPPKFLFCITHIITHIHFFPPVALRPNTGHGLLILDVSRPHTTTHHSR